MKNSNEPIPFDALAAEMSELDTLTEHGIEFKTPRRTFRIQQPYLGTLDHLSREFINLTLSQERMRANPLQESKRLASRHARRCARIMAIAALNGKWQIKWLTTLFAWYFRWHSNPSSLFTLTLIINRSSSLTDFYQLYQVSADANEAKSGKAKSRTLGPKSPYGSRGAICAHFHWSYEYLLWGIRWPILQRMLLDAPSYDVAEAKQEGTTEELTEENMLEIMKRINKDYQ
ncbi:hypothetical protein GCM10028805_54340 [Spirosoma harenae]